VRMAEPVRRELLLQPRRLSGGREDLPDALVGDRDNPVVGLLLPRVSLEVVTSARRKRCSKLYRLFSVYNRPRAPLASRVSRSGTLARRKRCSKLYRLFMAYEITVVADSLLQLVKRYFSAASVQEPPELFHARGGRKLGRKVGPPSNAWLAVGLYLWGHYVAMYGPART
jgi:hypothetical protein